MSTSTLENQLIGAVIGTRAPSSQRIDPDSVPKAVRDLVAEASRDGLPRYVAIESVANYLEIKRLLQTAGDLPTPKVTVIVEAGWHNSEHLGKPEEWRKANTDELATATHAKYRVTQRRGGKRSAKRK